MNKPMFIPEPNSQPRPCILPGLASLKKQIPLAMQVCNRMDWGPNNLLAYASQNLVVISDPFSVQHLITLHGHKYPVTAVRWYQHEGYREFREESNRLLVSGDDHGYLVFWNVQKGRKVYAFLDEGGEVLQIRILNNCVLSLSNRSMLSCWSLSQKKRTWRIDLGERDVFSFSIDPFTQSTIILACQSGWILSLLNVMTDHRPRTVQKKFRLSSRSPNQKFSGLFLRDIIHSPHKKGQYYLVTANEVAIFDDTIEKALSVRKLQYMRSEFVKLFVYDDLEDELYSLHGDGSVIYWKWEPSRRKYLMKKLDYVVRSGKISKEKAGSIFSVSFSRYYNNQFAVTDTCGKLWVWKYRRSKKKWTMKGILESINSLVTTMKIKDNLMAIGTVNGSIIIYDLLKCDVLLRYSLFSSSIKGIVWVGDDELVVYSSSGKKGSELPSMTSPTREGVTARGRRNSSQTGEKGKSNELVILNLKHGKTRLFRRNQEREKIVVLAATVSDSRRYLLLILKDRPIELWNLRTLVLLKVLKIRQVMTVTWCPQSRKQKLRKNVPEQFILSKQGGHLSFYLVTEEPTKRKTEVVEIQKKRFSTYTSISAVARKDSYLVCGDVEGNLLVIARNKETKTIATHRGYIRRILFSPMQNLIAVLFVDGGFAVYNLASSQRIATSPKYIRSVSVEWTSNDLLAIASVTGIVYIFDTTLTHASSSFLKHSIDFPLMSPALLPKHSLLYLKHSLLLNLISKKPMEPFQIQIRHTTPLQEGNQKQANIATGIDGTDPSASAMQHITYYKNCFGERIPILDPTSASGRHPLNVRITIQPSLHEQLVPEYIKKRLRWEEPSLSFPKRALLVSKFFGDNLGWKFWALVQKFLPDLVLQKNEILEFVAENERKKRLAEPLEERPPPSVPKVSKVVPPPKKKSEEKDQDEEKKKSVDVETISKKKTKEKKVYVEEEEEEEEDVFMRNFSTIEEEDSGITELEYTQPRQEHPFPLSGLFSIYRPRHQVSYEEHVNVGNYDQTIREGRSRDLIKIVGTHEALLGRKDDAVNLLVETPSSHSDMIANFLHACVISASNSQEHFKQTVLLVSSNLFSFGSLDNQKTKEYIFLGVELLCLIGEGLKACKVLQNFEFWDDAARIAKTTLKREDCNNILARWALHLERSKKFMEAISVWLSLGCTYNCVKLLHDLGLSDVAYMFVRSCMEVGFPLLTNARSSSVLEDGALEYPPEGEIDLLLKKVMHKYKMFLKDVGLDGGLENLKSDKEQEGEKEKEEEDEGEEEEENKIEDQPPIEEGILLMEGESSSQRKKKEEEEEEEESEAGEKKGDVVVNNLLNFGD